MSISTGGTEILGGGAGYGFGGFGGIAPIGLIGLNSFLGNGYGNGLNSGAAAVPGTTVLEQNVSDLRKDVAETSINVERLGNEMQQAFATQNLSFSGEFRNLDNQICDVEKTLLQSSYAQSLQAFQNTQAIQNQVTAFQVANDAKFCNLENQIHADGDQTRALINSIEMQNLRDALEIERRGRSEREVEINITNSNTSLQNQIALQAQQQQQQFASFENLVSDQLARQTNSLVNIGGTMTGTGQSNSSANTKVN